MTVYDEFLDWYKLTSSLLRHGPPLMEFLMSYGQKYSLIDLSTAINESALDSHIIQEYIHIRQMDLMKIWTEP